MLSGAKLGHDGYAETIKALIDHPGYKVPLGKNQGRGVASGYWFNGGGEFERDRSGQRRWHRRGGDGQPRCRRLARLDGDHGGRDAGRRIRSGARRSWPTPHRSATRMSPAARASRSRPAWPWSTRRKSRSLTCASAPPRHGASIRKAWSGRTATRRPASSNVGDFKPMSIKEIAAKRAATGGPDHGRRGRQPRRRRARLRHAVL